eukprot:TRINITY_DN11168_c0_g1_i1.p2 TRINITY_DN11168_c0_g1~~TRINITY_DN11168_c0_g1_i1.p2  ORF type:complete len:119 (+),score=19.36 TRINITY_DN11168_c0_g1_i1:190-546(+)
MSLLHTIYGIHSKEECVLDYDQFKLSLAKLGADFFDYEIDALFNMIDIKRDKLIDIDEWVEIVCQESNLSVSYTHLTLPTICSVQISVVAGLLKKKKQIKSNQDKTVYKQMTDQNHIH